MNRLELSLKLSKIYKNQPKVLAVTGTNGKTSVVDYIRQIFEYNSIKAASIGSLGCILKDYVPQTQYIEPTLPSPKSLYPLLDEISKHCEYVAIEATSHGLHQYRMHGVKIEVAGFTNISQDHLDYHKSMENYFKAKAMLFNEILEVDKIAVFNKNSNYYNALVNIHKKHISYGTKDSDVFIENIKNTIYGIEYTFHKFGEKIKKYDEIYGDFQIENIMCAKAMVNNLSKYPVLKSPKGRLEKVRTFSNGSSAFVDHAHTPDALKKSLISLKKITNGKLVIVFGCGGNRDRTKRKTMGQIASKICDTVIITDDNPRFEDPKQIRQEILSGCDNKKTFEALNRKDAIIFGLNKLSKNDVIVISGKGDEQYQIIKDQKIPFSDHQIILDA